MSTTTNIGLFKHDNPSTNTEQFNIDKSLNQNWDKTDKAFGEDRERLDLLEASNTIYNFKGKADTLDTIKSKTATQGDVWYCIADSTYYAYNGSDWIPVNLNLKLEAIDELKEKTIKVLQEVETPTPVSGTSIDLTDSAEAKITEIKISGNSKQDTREGYNLLGFGNGSTTLNGITYTINNGKITLNGTATAMTKFFIPLLKSFTIVANKIITMQAFNPVAYNGTSGDLRLRLFSSTSEEQGLLDVKNINSSLITRLSTSDFTATQLIIRIENGTTLSNFELNPQVINEENTSKLYEQYGASPSPDYPSEIESCGDNENLLDMVNGITTQTINGVTITNNSDGSITLNGTSTATISKQFSNTMYDLPIGVYALSSNESGYVSGDYSTILYTKETESSTAQMSISTTYKNHLNKSITSNMYSYYLWLYIGSGITFNKYRIKPKLEKGAVVTPYSSYGQGCINEVICNKNKLDISKIGSVAYDSGIRNNGNLEYSINPTVDNRDWNYNSSNHFIDLKAGTYTLTVFFDTKISNSSGGLAVFSSAGKQLKFLQVYNVNKATGTFTIEEDTNIGIFFKIYDGKARLQLEKNTIATDYVEHKPQTFAIPTQPMRSIGDIRDTFIKINNKWYEKHYINRLILNGTENWVKSSSYSNETYFCGYLEASISGFNENHNVFNSHFSNHGLYDSITNEECMANRSQCQVRILASRLSENSVNGFKTWLQELYNAGTPVYVDYVLTTPIDIECTEEQSTILFDIEQNAKTYDKVTHIYSTDEIEPNIEITYKKDIETLFANTLVEGV